jgi:hypothetical protein
LFDQVGKLVENDDRILLGEISENLFPVFPYPGYTREGFRSRIDELLELEGTRFLSRLIDDGVSIPTEGLFDEGRLTEPSAPVDDCQFGVVRVVECAEP